MNNFWSRWGQSFLSTSAKDARPPLLAWEASWDEAEALIASGKLWSEPPQVSQDAYPSTVRQPHHP